MSGEIKYGSVRLNVEALKSIGKLDLRKTQLQYTPFYVFQFALYKRTVRQNQFIEANILGYALFDPVKNRVSQIKYDDGALPQPKRFDTPLTRECISLVLDSALEDAPFKGKALEVPSMTPVNEAEKAIEDMIVRDLTVRKTYFSQSRRKYDSGIKEAIFIFNRGDITDFHYYGCIMVPIFALTYAHPDSTKEFRRDVLAYSGEVILNEVKCSKSKALGRECTNLPDNVCPICKGLVCVEHQKRCENCGALICENCIISKGTFFKHFYCPKCTE